MRLGKNRNPACSWVGDHSGSVETSVETNTPCGHNLSTTPTCARHLGLLLSQGGKAPIAVPCATCGEVQHSRFTNSFDL